MNEQPPKSTPDSDPPENTEGVLDVSSTDLHGKIVEKIRMLNPASVIRLGIDCLHDMKESDAGSAAAYSGIEPKNIMLVIRWVYQHHECGRDTRAPSVDDLRDLSRDISGLESLAENEKISAMGPHDWPHIDYHRRPHQDSRFETGPSVPRQLILFHDKLGVSELDKKFQEKHQMSMLGFILIYTSCCAYLVARGKRTLSVQALRDKWGKNDADKFLNAIARDFEGASRWMKEHSERTMLRKNPQRSLWRQLREPTPLVRIPLFRDGDSLRPYSLEILETGLRENLYEMFKGLGIGFPGRCFGNAYEEYIRCLVKKLRLPFLCEQELREAMGADSSRADCVVFDKEKSVIIEVKSTTPPHMEMAEQDFVGAGFSTRDNILDGVSQIAHTANWLKIPDKRNIFGVVVTYGKYEHTWETIGKRARAYVQEKLGCLGNPILTDQCFFLDVGDFEYLIDAALHDIGFGDALCRLARQQSQNESFVFQQGLECIVQKPLPTPTWLMDRMNEWFAWMEKVIQGQIAAGDSRDS